MFHFDPSDSNHHIRRHDNSQEKFAEQFSSRHAIHGPHFQRQPLKIKSDIRFYQFAKFDEIINLFVSKYGDVVNRALNRLHTCFKIKNRKPDKPKPNGFAADSRQQTE